MKCINCATEMILLQSAVEIDECPQCDAHWFDKGELTETLAASNVQFDEAALRKSLALPTRCRWCETDNRDGTVDCSLCREPLGHRCPRDDRPMLHAKAKDLEFDVCPVCSGIWLDGDELRRFIRAHFPEEVGGLSAPQDDEDFLDPQTASDHLMPCQVCGARVSAEDLGWHAGWYKCRACLIPQTTEDSARLTRLRAQNLKHWRRILNTERIFYENVGDLIRSMWPLSDL
jgi:Zn-finger nucleic acid-binding protein